MPLPVTIALDSSDLLTLAGVFVAVLAAVYSAKSARASHRQACAAEVALKQADDQLQLARDTLSESKRQNRIASHELQLRAFRALLAFASQTSANGIQFKQECVWELWEHARIAEFYFSTPVAKLLESIVDTALQIQSARDEWQLDNTFPQSERTAAVERTYALLKGLRAMLDTAEKLMREELRLVGDKT